jgi:site-specific DNA-methyltransferase (adenine-specific)
VAKAALEATTGTLVVGVLPARTDTRWWQRWVVGQEFRFLSGRLRFGGARSSAPFPSAVVVFRPPSVVAARRPDTDS